MQQIMPCKEDSMKLVRIAHESDALREISSAARIGVRHSSSLSLGSPISD